MCEPEAPVDDLSQFVTPRKCVAFVGSGPSTPVFKDWPSAVSAVCGACGIDLPGDERSLNDPETLLRLADDARDANGSAYYRCLGERFGHLDASPTIYYELMRVPFKSYITLNFDPCLAHESKKEEHKCALKWFPDLDRADIEKRTLFYLHGLIQEGMIPDNGSLLFARSDFEKAYHRNSPLTYFLVPTLEREEVLFIGCELREPAFREVFQLCERYRNYLVGSKAPRRYALLPYVEADTAPTGDRENDGRTDEQERDERFKSYGITVLRYRKIDKHYRGLRLLFERLAEVTREPPSLESREPGAS
ncbi:MAG: SIR2 family protein [Planctomycetia bacterium]|nr:SIR2 family protein [Planctomycetia bacterium]